MVVHMIRAQGRVGYSGGSREGSLEPPFKTKLFQFHGDFYENLGKTTKTNPPLAI